MKNIKAIAIFFESVLFSLMWFLVSSCTQKREQHLPADKTSNKIIPPKIIWLADLPDSSKPTVTLMKEMPKPTSVTNKPPTVHSFIDSVTHEPIAPEAQGMGLFKNFTTDHGLALDAIIRATKDKSGNLWFGTSGGGVSRFDGKSFTNYTTAEGLVNNTVYCITEDKAGNLWFGTSSGVSCYDGISFTKYAMAGLANYTVCNITEDKTGNLWFATLGGGVIRYDGKKFTAYTTSQGLPDNNIAHTAEDKMGNLWFGTLKGGVSRFDGERFTNYTTADGLANNFVFTIKEDKAGNLWIGTREGVSQYDGKKFTNYTTAQGLPNNKINSIAEDKRGNIWLSAYGNGVSGYNGQKFTNYTTAQGLANNMVTDITEDEKGNLWFSTWGGGVSRYEGKSFTNYTTAQGLAGSLVKTIIEDKAGNLWFGTDGGGVSHYDGKSFTNYTTEQGLSWNHIQSSIIDRMGNLWFGTNGGGVSRYDGKSFTNYSTSKWSPVNYIFNMLEDKRGNVWFGTIDNGVSCYDGERITSYTTSQGLIHNSIRSITEDKSGNLWFCTAGGLSRFDGKSLTNYSTSQGLTNNDVTSILEDKAGNLWLGTVGGGVCRYDGKTFNNFSVAEGLPDNVVISIISDSESNIIFGTNSGLGILDSFKPNSKEEKRKKYIPAQNKLSNEDLKNYSPQFHIYNSSTGYPIKDLNNTGKSDMLQDSKGIIWIGTGSDKIGLVRFDYKSLHHDDRPPLVILQSIKIDNENICWYDLLPRSAGSAFKADSNTTAPNITEEVTTLGKILNDAARDSMRRKFGNIKFDSITRWYPIPQNLVLPYKHNSISFDFNAIETGKNFLVDYQYILEGYDKEWNPVTKNSTATFGNIYEGTYTFKLKAQSPDGVWSGPLLYTFKVLPPWYRTWWAYSLYLVLFIVALRTFIKWRLSAIKKEKERLEEKLEMQNAVMNERTRISRELHDEVGATLSGIAMYSHLTKEQIKNANTDEVEKSLNIMQQSAGEMVNKLNDIVWLVNPEQDSLQKLIQRLEEYARDMAAIKNMEVKVNAPEHLKEHSLPVESRRNIYLFCKEAINNAVKYSNDTLLELNIKEVDHKLEFSVSDNGKGFDAVMVRRGNGLNNMQKRADEIGAKLIVQSNHREGSMLSMQVKIT